MEPLDLILWALAVGVVTIVAVMVWAVLSAVVNKVRVDREDKEIRKWLKGQTANSNSPKTTD